MRNMMTGCHLAARGVRTRLLLVKVFKVSYKEGAGKNCNRPQKRCVKCQTEQKNIVCNIFNYLFGNAPENWFTIYEKKERK